MLDTQKGAIWIMFIIVYIVIGILLLNTMLMAVFERVRELGVLNALGASPGSVLRLILTECGIQVGIAMSPIIPFGIYPENAVTIAILVVVATLLSGIYPAWRAARVVPVDTIKLV